MRWGYREVRTSTIDYFDIIRGGIGEGFADSIFKLQDSDGKLLSLRGEVTTQIARMLASSARNEGRLFYIANCLRFLEPKTLSQREYWQAGAELMGGEEVASDAEAISLILSALSGFGLKDAHIDIGSVRLFKALAERFGVSDYEKLTKAVMSKSSEDLKTAVPDPVAREVFSFVMSKRGGPDVVEELANLIGGGFEEECRYFKELFTLLDVYGCADRVSVDLSTLRELKYYTGTVFEIFLGGFGIPIGGGGRYDAMMKEFGLENTTATGFAVSVDMCVKAIEAEGFDFNSTAYPLRIFYKDGFREKAVQLAMELRIKGEPCTVDSYGGEKEGILVGELTIDIARGKTYGV